MLARRLLLLRIVLLVAFLAFAGKLAYLQLLRGGELRHASVRNQLRWVRSPAPRGVILDRTGAVLATNTPAMAAWLVSGEVARDRWDALLARLVAIGIFPDLQTAAAALAEHRRLPSYLPLRLGSNLTMAQVTRVEEEGAFLPGIYLRAEPVRAYPGGALAVHALGYVREIDAEELAARRTDGYRQGDRIGKSGLEKTFEAALRGQDGREEVEVDARGSVLRSVRQVPPREGQTVVLTLHAVLQRAAESALAGRKGAVVALDPRTGDILALASAPSYDPTSMSGRLSPESWAWLQRSHALVNRGLERYPPGSVFKIVTAAAALETGKAHAGSYFYCPGAYHNIRCWKHAGHGTLGITAAIAQSCNVAFMHMAEDVGIASLAKMARRFGLGERTGLEVLPERRGLVPDAGWAKETGRRWQLGDTLQTGMGQSFLTITPLQGARLIAAIANGGKLVTPRLVQQVGDAVIPTAPPTPIGLQPGTLRGIARGLRAVTHGEGTARGLDPALRIAGKTGTAQNPGPDHAWFAGYAPADAPKIAVVVLVEHGGHGGAAAAPIAEAV
ncbi:MAG TPA: penicillin-binding protein 2, partial [Armatimonadota bacterium]|nr:penicillin-binding protein 2 [Armatimonadota bacterium]